MAELLFEKIAIIWLFLGALLVGCRGKGRRRGPLERDNIDVR